MPTLTRDHLTTYAAPDFAMNTLIDQTYDQFADDSYDLSRIKHTAIALCDALTTAYVSCEIEELASRLRELLAENNRRHVAVHNANCSCPDGHNDMDF